MITKSQVKIQEEIQEKQQELISLAEEIIDEYINTSACTFNKLIDFKLRKQCLEFLISTGTSLKNVNKLTPISDVDAIERELSDNENILKKDNDITEKRYGSSTTTAASAEVLNLSGTSDKEMGKKRDDYTANIPSARKSIKRSREEEIQPWKRRPSPNQYIRN